jgi:hypothetical protein
LESFGGKGGGFSSIAHILFLANPCSSSDPQFPNYYENLGLRYMCYAWYFNLNETGTKLLRFETEYSK